MHEIQIKILQTQILQALLAGGKDLPFSVHVIPHLGSDKQILAPDYVLCEKTAEYRADLLFILIDRRTVNQTVAVLYGTVYCLGNGFGIVLIRSESSQAYSGDFLPAVQFSCWYFVLFYF